jgi:Zn finger protein HypA/HybF involved in hydrogenase expression
MGKSQSFDPEVSMTALNSVSEDVAENETESLELIAKKAKNARAKEQVRIAYEARTTARNCLGCGDEFRSEGAHHRMCNRCRSRR